MKANSNSCCDMLDVTSLAPALAALSHPARVGIVLELAGAGPSCCKQVVGKFDLAQSTVSQHLKVLVDAGLVRLRPDAQRSIYEVDVEALNKATDALARLTEVCRNGAEAKS